MPVLEKTLSRGRHGRRHGRHGDIRHAGDRIEKGERMQLVAFFYGKERRGNALPLAKTTKAEEMQERSTASAAQIISESWPIGAKCSPDGQPMRSARSLALPASRLPPNQPLPKGLSEKARAEGLREITLRDVASLAKL